MTKSSKVRRYNFIPSTCSSQYLSTAYFVSWRLWNTSSVQTKRSQWPTTAELIERLSSTMLPVTELLKYTTSDMASKHERIPDSASESPFHICDKIGSLECSARRTPRHSTSTKKKTTRTWEKTETKRRLIARYWGRGIHRSGSTLQGVLSALKRRTHIVLLKCSLKAPKVADCDGAWKKNMCPQS